MCQVSNLVFFSVKGSKSIAVVSNRKRWLRMDAYDSGVGLVRTLDDGIARRLIEERDRVPRSFVFSLARAPDPMESTAERAGRQASAQLNPAWRLRVGGEAGSRPAARTHLLSRSSDHRMS